MTSQYSAENSWTLPWPNPWPLILGVEFAGGGSFAYESASVLVGNYLNLDPLGSGRRGCRLPTSGRR